jgi:hypothetical protein
MSTAEVLEKWYIEAVPTYSARSLTYSTDKLVAISAATKATYLNRHVDYVAGSWNDCIMPGLLWRRDSLGRKNRSCAYPSWSWASQESSVDYLFIRGFEPLGNTDPQVYESRVIDVHVETRPTNPFGDVKSGYLKLDTLVSEGWIMRHSRQSYNRYDYFRDFISSTPDRTDIWTSAAVMDEEEYKGCRVTVALMGVHILGWISLLLKPVQEREHTYRRVGILLQEKYSPSVRLVESPWRCSGVEQKIITIV